MNYTLDEMSSWDLFFYYGQNPLDLEIQSDLMLLCLQPDRSLYYNNLESGGIVGSENFPNTISLQVNLRYSISIAVARKNRFISDGTDGKPERRIAVSQNSIKFDVNRNELDTQILYIPYYNYNAYAVIRPLPGLS